MRLLAVLLIVSLPAAAAPAPVNTAVTIDDLLTHGPLPAGRTRAQVAKAMIKALEEAKVPDARAFITYFGPGSNHSQDEVTTAWRKEGYGFGNHTAAHLSLHKLSTSEFIREIDACEPLLREVSAGKNWKYFRYPYLHEGETREKREGVRAHLKAKGYKVVPITFSITDKPWEAAYATCLDRGNTSGADKMRTAFVNLARRNFRLAVAAARAAGASEPDQIFMLHAGAIQADSLPAILKALSEEGARYVPLETLMAKPGLSEAPRAKARGITGSGSTFSIEKAPPAQAQAPWPHAL